jgi:hypothetical protein
MPKSLAFRRIDSSGSVVVVLGSKPPSDADWNLLVEAHKQGWPRRGLVVTAGGGPTAVQRQAVLDATGGKGIPAAILTDSMMVRGIVTAISWFASQVRAFPPHDLEGALHHLGITMPVAAVQRVIDELKGELERAGTQARTG